MLTLTEKMIVRREALAHDYRILILAGDGGEATEFEFGQWQRANGILSYLESRLSR